MPRPIFLAVLCVSIGISAAIAQIPEPAKPAAPEMPPEVKAMNEANKIADPEKKIEAFQKIKKDFPKSMGAAAADSVILSTLVKKMPDQKARILKQARLICRSATAKDRAAEANGIAVELLNAGILLKDAEGYAKKSVKSMALAAYLQEQKAGYEERKQKAPPEEELRKRFRESRAARVAVLGRIELKLGKTSQGRKLLEEVYAVTQDNGPADAALGELAAEAGNDSKAMEYLIPARLSGRAPDTATAAMDAIYRKSHNGALDGLDSMLDAEYRKRYPNPIKVEAYKPTEKRSDRLVLAEVFTGAGCPPCVAADLAFDAAMERYTRKDLAVLMYHVHIPRPDPMTTVQTEARRVDYKVNGVPSFAIDGDKSGGGGSRDYAKYVFDRFQKDLEKDLESPAEARLKVDARLNGNTVKVTAAVADVTSKSKDLKLQLQIVLVEKDLRYTGENGVRFHPMVVRAMGGEKGEGFKVDPAGTASFDQSFDLDAVSQAIKTHLDEYEAKGHRGESFKFSDKKYQINHADLAIVVFIQDDKSKHVLQAGYVDLATEGAAHTVTQSNELK